MLALSSGWTVESVVCVCTTVVHFEAIVFLDNTPVNSVHLSNCVLVYITPTVCIDFSFCPFEAHDNTLINDDHLQNHFISQYIHCSAQFADVRLSAFHSYMPLNFHTICCVYQLL